jgi:hypothetical protein
MAVFVGEVHLGGPAVRKPFDNTPLSNAVIFYNAAVRTVEQDVGLDAAIKLGGNRADLLHHPKIISLNAALECIIAAATIVRFSAGS